MQTRTLQRKGFKRPRLLIIGCGDIGLRILTRLRNRFRIVALTRSPQRIAELRAAGAVPMVGQLSQRHTLARLRALARYTIHLAPPPGQGHDDPQTRNLLHALGADEQQLVYVSTTGVYGDRGGAWVNESAPAKPASARAIRRLSAERLCRAWQKRAMGDGRRVSILRAPGIYALDRLPMARLQEHTPCLRSQDDVYTNHIHAEDLARAAIAALWRGRAARVVNVVDDTELKMGDYFDWVADHLNLPRPPRLARADLMAQVSPMRASFMNESRRLRNQRLKTELRLRLHYPTVADALKSR